MQVDGPVLGLDLSLTSTGAVVYDGDDVVEYLSIKTDAKASIEERIEEISTSVLRLWKRTRPVYVVRDAGLKSKFTDDRIYYVTGVVIWRLWRRGALTVPVASNSMLKEFTGNAGGTSAQRKARILAAVREVWPDCPNHDCADAYGFAWMGYRDKARLLTFAD